VFDAYLKRLREGIWEDGTGNGLVYTALAKVCVVSSLEIAMCLRDCDWLLFKSCTRIASKYGAISKQDPLVFMELKSSTSKTQQLLITTTREDKGGTPTTQDNPSHCMTHRIPTCLNITKCK
jgi:hypothetical protein